MLIFLRDFNFDYTLEMPNHILGLCIDGANMSIVLYQLNYDWVMIMIDSSMLSIINQQPIIISYINMNAA